MLGLSRWKDPPGRTVPEILLCERWRFGTGATPDDGDCSALAGWTFQLASVSPSGKGISILGISFIERPSRAPGVSLCSSDNTVLLLGFEGIPNRGNRST